MTKVDFKQNHKIQLMFMGLTALSGIVAFFVYFDNKRDAKIKQEILELDKNIKELQLYKLQKTV